jgi:NADPH-dependent 2,4-dienoyl-CoA reductase/sulfur reductase-like enzyme/rhodanese-related sulfurtransferase
MKVCIVGGVAGGATVAARMRRRDESAEIIIFERGDYVSFANCGLPYYIGGIIEDRNELFVMTPERLKERLNVDARISSEVLSIDRENKSIQVRGADGVEYVESYDKLVLSPGAEPIRPPIPGIDQPGIFSLRNIPDTDAITSFLEERKPQRAVIVGAGFIGLEMAESLRERGVFVTIVEAESQVMNVLDFEMAAEIHKHLKRKRVELYLNDGVESFKKNGRAIEVTLQSGRVLPTDLVLLSIGVRPESKLASEAGLAVGKRGAIVVNEYLGTDDPDVYAVGDAIEFPHPITGVPVSIPLAWPANYQGRIVADNIVDGNKKTYPGTYGTAIAKVFDMTAASTGLSEKQLRSAGIPHKAAIVHSISHAGYYPGGQSLTVKIIFDPESGRLLGAQAVGYEGVDKRIDMLSSCIIRGGSACDLAFLEHAYAPPYASAKDPVNIAGYIAENIINGISNHIQWHELSAMAEEDFFLLDVRTVGEFEDGAIPDAANIPVDELRNRMGEIPNGKPVVVYCQIGQRAYFAERILRQSGFDTVYNLSGGYTTYRTVNRKQSNEDVYKPAGA